MCASQYFMDLSCENINYTPSGIKLIWSAIFYFDIYSTRLHFMHKANLSFKLSGHYSTQSQMAQIWPRKFLNWATCLVRKVNLYCFGYINLNLFDFQFISIYPFWKSGVSLLFKKKAFLFLWTDFLCTPDSFKKQYSKLFHTQELKIKHVY